VNIEERRLADVLHRTTPEPPRPVTVEQVAYRLVGHSSGPRLGRQPRGRERRPRRGFGLSHAWAPVMAAAAVIVIAGASAGVAVLANSHHNPSSSTGGGPPASSTVSSGTASSSPSQTPSSPRQTTPAAPIAGGPWGAELIDHQTFDQVGLVSADGSLYAYSNGYLDRIDPATGTVAATTPDKAMGPNSPVIVGNTVWVVWSNSGGNVLLHGYNAQTLEPTASVLVPAIGGVASSASNVLTAGPDGRLYVAAGVTVAVVDPAGGNLINRIYLTAGMADSLAVSPDGSTLYVGVTPSSGGFKLLVYDLASNVVTAESTLADTDSGGNLVATSGGVWGTTGAGMSEWTWFAPTGDLSRAVRIGQGAGAGFASLPSYSGGVVWVGGSHTLTCASPANGRVLGSATLPTDHGVVEYFGSPAVAGDHAYADYADDASQLSGLVRMTPPAACSGLSS
jgi:sugar lactone lactonase YvrE